VSWHRRKLAVVLAVAAALTGINAALPPEPLTVAVVRAASRLDGGRILTAADLTSSRVPVDAAPDGALGDLSAVVGQKLTAPITRGQVLTNLSIVSAGRSVRRGLVVAPLRLADADVVALLKVGDVVDVVAADGEARRAVVVARAVRVVGLPQAPEDTGIGGSISTSSGALALVEVDPKTATLLAQAAVSATLSVVLR
jgi:Flp pilus assembly protein CpaB